MVLFDGVCNLCNRGIAFIIRRDPAGRFRFAALQSEAGRRLLEQATGPGPLPDSMVVVADGRARFRSAAALRIARGMRWPWPLLGMLAILPRPLRDWLYDVVAKNRYRWFGKRDQCMIPTPELAGRFLEETPTGAAPASEPPGR